ncbi:phosphate ABC transporter permease subunit PstC [Pikeienuella piscinae]|uniref:Phosphate transport system permease protein n=1 Tax=Pikeienuella piscinae TaxID=2748098 RepID=A0A7M3T6Q2_9RHOB|nr:phosphate ABC transporter permease subunit PstC [Pikeienuella piscinae]QIE57683.1 phosphate ABC transporter permease subunit PstC [Pikeienuella piscinae]
MIQTLVLIIAVTAIAGYFLNREAAKTLRGGGAKLHSLPSYHGGYALSLIALPAIIFLLLWLLFESRILDALILAGIPDEAMAGKESGEVSLMLAEIRQTATGRIFGEPTAYIREAAARLNRLDGMADWALAALIVMLMAGGLYIARRSVAAEFRARQRVERTLSGLMVFASVLAVFTTLGIIASLLYESARFFAKVPINEFLFGLNWEPQIPIREDQVAGLGAFGWLPVFLGTIVISVIAMALATPIGLLSAIYLNQFAPKRLRDVAKPLLEILAGVPTVVYGFFAILTVAPALRAAGASLGIPVSPNTALAAGGVMGIMLIPFISSFADDALSAVPRGLRDGSLALGATQGETVRKVLFPAAIPGIVGGVLLAVSRAIGETMIVVMAAGLIATLTINPLDSVTTVTVQIVTLLIGDTSFDNPKTLAAFALGLMLFVVTLGLNIIALRVVRKYRELYD